MNKDHKQELITAVGIDYIETVVLDLMSKSFDAYQKRDPTRRQFQTSIGEHSHASAGILLTVIAVETIRNIISYYGKATVTKRPIQDLAQIIYAKDKLFPKE